MPTYTSQPMIPFRSPEIEQWTTVVGEVRRSAVSKRASLESIHSTWAPNDTRLTTFSKIINVSNSVQLSLAFAGQHLLDSSWWRTNTTSGIPNRKDLQALVTGYIDIAKIGYMQLVFSAIESGFRIFLKALDSSACNAGTGEFKSIYDCLLKSKLKTPIKNSIELMDLLRLVRNTIHNNGVYFHKSGQNQSITYKGKTYNFVQGNAVDFVTWDFLINIVADSVEMIENVVSSPEIAAVTSIADPFQ